MNLQGLKKADGDEFVERLPGRPATVDERRRRPLASRSIAIGWTRSNVQNVVLSRVTTIRRALR